MIANLDCSQKLEWIKPNLGYMVYSRLGLPSLNMVIVSLGITILPSLLILDRKLWGKMPCSKDFYGYL